MQTSISDPAPQKPTKQQLSIMFKLLSQFMKTKEAISKKIYYCKLKNLDFVKEIFPINKKGIDWKIKGLKIITADSKAYTFYNSNTFYNKKEFMDKNGVLKTINNNFPANKFYIGIASVVKNETPHTIDWIEDETLVYDFKNLIATNKNDYYYIRNIKEVARTPIKQEKEMIF